MSDFDFDEIDKAVAGAISDDGQDIGAQDDIGAETPHDNSEVEASRTVPPAARRSAGRFMDVMHPSSDMRTRTEVPARPTPPLAPEPKQEPSLSLEDEEPELWAKPLESPFLPDAKVEKRPLGGIATDAQPFPSQQQDELLLEAPDEPLLEATTMPDPIDFATQQQETSEDALEPKQESEPEPALELEDEPESADIIKGTPFAIPLEDTPAEVTKPVLIEEPTTDQAPTGPSSITQQYTEQPSSQQESGAIYDTENYHQPVTHPPKHRSGAWTVLWISLLVIIGAGAGVAFYLFVFPNL